MILMIDNYDSFTFNIVEYYRRRNHDIRVVRNDEITIQEIEAMEPQLIILSPGPKDPESAGICVEVIKYFANKIPIFGVCLGCQSIAVAFGGRIIRAEKMYHGKTSLMTHSGQGILKNVASPMKQMRYHSLIVDETTLPEELEVTARSESGEIMALRHKFLPIEAVQFHPESIASVQGGIIMDNATLMMKEGADSRGASTGAIKSGRLSLEEEQKMFVERLLLSENLSKEEASTLMAWFSEGQMSPESMAMVLTALRMKGESADEIAGIAEEVRKRAKKLDIASDLPYLVDIVGTGGDSRNTFNISTTAAIVAAGAGANVAKHGNRAVSSKSGSADVLETMGVAIEASIETMSEMLGKAGMCFMFAPLYHPAMKNVVPVRRAMGVRTVFNILGPLVNPAQVPNILLGVYAKKLMPLMADALESMGIRRALVVHSEMGVDEITLDGKTEVIEIVDGERREYRIDPNDYFEDLRSIGESEILEHLEGGDSKENARLIENLLKGELLPETKEKVVRYVVTLNAGAALYICGKAESIEEGIKLAEQSIRSGSAQKVLETMRSFGS